MCTSHGGQGAHLEELVTYSDPSPSRRALLRHPGDENTLQDRDKSKNIGGCPSTEGPSAAVRGPEAPQSGLQRRPRVQERQKWACSGQTAWVWAALGSQASGSESAGQSWEVRSTHSTRGAGEREVRLKETAGRPAALTVFYDAAPHNPSL